MEVRMRRLILVILLGLSPAALAAQTVPPDDDLRGHYRGFAQSVLNAGLRMPMALMVERSDGSEFFGRLTLGPLPFAFQGKIEDSGRFKGRGTGEAGDVTFIGTAQGFADTGVLARASYKFTPATGARADQGTADFIRAPFLPPDPVLPVEGAYLGIYASQLGQGDRMLRLELTQDGTALAGQLFLDDGAAIALSWDVVGGIQPCTTAGGIAPCTVVLVGSGSGGRLLAAGGFEPPPDDGLPPPDDGLRAVISIEFVNGAVDVATGAARR
jgi:hypothetical protein